MNNIFNHSVWKKKKAYHLRKKKSSINEKEYIILGLLLWIYNKEEMQP